MQLIQQKQNTIEKIIRDGDGRLVRATFAVYESYGRIKARLLYVVFIDEVSEIGNAVLKIGGFSLPHAYPTAIFVHAKIVSPYFSNSFYILGSKPRAPTL